MPGLPPLQPPSIPITFDQDKGRPAQPFYQYLMRLDQIIRSFLFSDGTPLVDNNAFTAYTPALSANTGTFTSASATGRFKQIGKLVFIQSEITITTNGTAGGTVVITLPVTAVANNYVIGGRARAVSGKSVHGITGTSAMNIINYDNSYPGANGEIIDVSGFYEAA